MLYHLGVDMGTIALGPTHKGYTSFECSDAARFTAPPDNLAEIIAGKGGSRDFRAYIEHRLANGKGPQGVKIGAAYWLGDPEPWTLPIDIVRVQRPLEDSLASDAHYQDTTRKSFSALDSILRAMQMTGYWQAANVLCDMIEPKLELDFYETLTSPMDAIIDLSATFNLNPTRKQENAACEFADPEMRHI